VTELSHMVPVGQAKVNPTRVKPVLSAVQTYPSADICGLGAPVTKIGNSRVT